MSTWVKSIADWAPVGSVLVAGGALYVASMALSANRKAHSENMAVQNFREFMKLCIDKPDLAGGRFGEMNDDTKTKYYWFVGYMLWTFERLTETYEKDHDWMVNIRSLLSRHCAYFDSHDFQAERKFYDEKVIKLIDEVRGAAA